MYAMTMSGGRTDVGAVQSVESSLLSPHELHRLFCHTPGAFRLIGELMYGTGARLEELLGLRVRDVESEGWRLVMRTVEGEPVRRLRLPQRLRDALGEHMERLREWYSQELAVGGAEADRHNLGPATPPLNGSRWCSQYLFPSDTLTRDTLTGCVVRGRLEAAAVQQILAQAGRDAGLTKPVYAHALRHAFAARYLERGRPITDLQHLLGHANPATTRRYAEVLLAAQRTPMAQPQSEPPPSAAPRSAVCARPSRQTALQLSFA